MVDCDPKSTGCSGGAADLAWEYLASAGGQKTEESYPYKGVDGTCEPSKGIVGAKVSKKILTIKKGDVKTMQTLLSNNQLFSVGMNMAKSFGNYMSVLTKILYTPQIHYSIITYMIQIGCLHRTRL